LLLFSAYIVFCQAKRAEVKAANPDATFGELGKILGKMWGKLDEKQKVNSLHKFDFNLQATMLTVQNLLFFYISLCFTRLTLSLALSHTRIHTKLRKYIGCLEEVNSTTKKLFIRSISLFTQFNNANISFFNLFSELKAGSLFYHIMNIFAKRKKG